MTPAEELEKLNLLIHQYETVSKTTKSTEQKARVDKQLRELRSYRDKLVAVNVIEEVPVKEAPKAVDPLDEYRILRRLRREDRDREPADKVPPLWADDAQPTPAQEEMFNLLLYARFFQAEFLPFLTETRLRLDFKFSLDRDSFYGRFQDLERKINDFRDENSRLVEGIVSREMELEMRKRTSKLKRQIQGDAAKLFRAIQAFCEELIEDARGDGVKCLNGDELVVFDQYEGKRALKGRMVREALAELSRLSLEIVTYLNVPDTDSEETGRADRY